MIKNLRHVGLVVSDMYRAIKFYQGLGFKVISRANETWGHNVIEVCKMTHNLELVKGRWLEHVAVGVKDFNVVDSWEAYGQKDNVKFIRDPDHNVIELVKEDDL